MTEPETCKNMTELRLVIDQIDDDLIGLLARRQRCIERAAVLKKSENLPADIPERVAEVLANVKARADTAGLDSDLAVSLWQEIIQRAIAREERILTPNSSTKD